MRGWLAVVVVLLVVSGSSTGVQGQPCTPPRLDPIPWPAGHPHYTDNEEVQGFFYGGGLYVLTIHGGNTPTDSLSFSAVSTSMQDFEVVQLPPLSSGLPPVLGIDMAPLFVRGWYYSTFNIYSTVIRSRDGKAWQRLNVAGSSLTPPINWTGEQFVVVGEMGDVWTSPDGAVWTYRTQVPATYRPIFTGLADRSRLVVTGAEAPFGQRRGYTEDYQH
jgi:hypothetical protein